MIDMNFGNTTSSMNIFVVAEQEAIYKLGNEFVSEC